MTLNTPICTKMSRINEAWDSGTYRFRRTKKTTVFGSQSYQNAYISYDSNHVKLYLGF